MSMSEYHMFCGLTCISNRTEQYSRTRELVLGQSRMSYTVACTVHIYKPYLTVLYRHYYKQNSDTPVFMESGPGSSNPKVINSSVHQSFVS